MIPKKQDLQNTPQFQQLFDESLPESVEKTDVVPEQAILKFVGLKASLNELKSQLEAAEAEALNEALCILQYNQNHGLNSTVYSDKMVRVSLSFRQRYGTAKDSPELARLEEEIRAEEVRLLKLNREKVARLDTQIEELESQIQAIQDKREKLLDSERLANLKARYQKAIQDSAYTVPGLVVHFKNSR